MANINGTEDDDNPLNGGGGDDIIYGLGGNDHLVGGGGNDRLVGGDDDDNLNGGGGNDTFVFEFTVAQGTGGTQTFTGFNGDSVSQGVFSSTVSQWLQHLISLGAGEDLDGNGAVDYEVNADSSHGDPDTMFPWIEGFNGFSNLQHINVTQGPNERDEAYYGTATIGGSDQITAADGNDTIVAFQSGDAIELKSITKIQAAALFTFHTGDFDSDGLADDSKVSWEGATDAADGSITILGVTWGDLNAFLNDSRIHYT